ncbi:MAG: transposase [Verrucomicrobia bacterium]|nr:transposase [Verrucomicrobiota bacterium]MDA1006730.1 transposase [Verrucomicrobiota bacterium]
MYLHLIFSTKDRYPYLGDSTLRGELHAYMAGVVQGLDCDPVEIGGVADHVHALIVHPRTRTIAEVLKEMKRVTTYWAKNRDDGMAKFKWQAGYGAFSVSQSNVAVVSEYIRDQEDHHRVTSFQEEYRMFLRKHAVEFDERYVWD